MSNTYSWSYPFDVNEHSCWYAVKLKTMNDGNFTKDYLKKELYICKLDSMDIPVNGTFKTYYETDIAKILVWSDVDLNQTLEYDNTIKFETLEDKNMFHNYIKELYDFNMNDYKSYAYHNLFKNSI